MSVLTWTLGGIAFSVFDTKASECPSAFSTVLRAMADMVEDGKITETPPINGQSRMLVASHNEMIGGVILYSEDPFGMVLDFAWIDPAIRRQGLFDAMAGRLMLRCWVNGKQSASSREPSSIEGRIALESIGFKKRGETYQWLPFRPKIGP